MHEIVTIMQYFDPAPLGEAQPEQAGLNRPEQQRGRPKPAPSSNVAGLNRPEQQRGRPKPARVAT